MKKVFISILVLVVVLIVIIFNGSNGQTIEKILKINLDDIAYIKTNSNEDDNYDVDLFIKEYRNKKYKKFDGSKGSTTNLRYICYDNDNQILFTLVDVGNQNLIMLIKNDSKVSSLYQQVN